MKKKPKMEKQNANSIIFTLNTFNSDLGKMRQPMAMKLLVSARKQGSSHVSARDKSSMKSFRQCLHINEVNNGSRVLGFAFLLVVQLKQSSYVTISNFSAAIVIPLITVLPPLTAHC
jgi:hypothetical protein